MPKRATKKRCEHPGCKKYQMEGSSTCAGHVITLPPGEIVLKMTDLERLNLVKLETECMNILLQLRNQELETEEVKRRFTADLNARSAHREQLMAIAETRKAEQQRTVKEIGAKYDLDPQQMAYDPESGVLRDLRETQGS